MSEDWRARTYPTIEEVRKVIRVIIERIEENRPVRIAAEYAAKKPLPVSLGKPIVYSQDEIDAAKALARAALEAEAAANNPAP